MSTLPVSSVVPNPAAELAQLPSWQGTPAFPKIPAVDLARQLTARLQSPSRIDQGTSSLCGPAVFLYSLAKAKPMAYAKLVMDLYKTGKGSIGNLQIQPGRDCRSFDPAMSGVEGADWIGLASLRDSENSVFDYQNPSNQFAGITLPSRVASWFRKAGWGKVGNETNLVFDESRKNFLEACRRFSTGETVCLFIGAKLLGAQIGWKGKVPADHWVVMDSSPMLGSVRLIGPIALTGQKGDPGAQPLEFSVYTWGSSGVSINARRATAVSLDTFLDFYYGFVSAS